ncbi:MAG: heme-binding protein [Candidatus Tectomicrobia bacterium]|uniref:Heme-binding protein n=1 Tax=Tectimicrobiota bacterium TaxID=2528274 RepID=A0A932GN79_UNCTE|nr:heme-binding protein [Candidatus Tectomicrobia bacterium]
MRKKGCLTLEDARILIEGAERKAADMKAPKSIAVADDGGHLIAFHRMDGANRTSIDIAINKAFTSACSHRATLDYHKLAAPGEPGFGLHMTNQGRLIIFGGGFPVGVDGEVVGGIGLSSGPVDEDLAVGEAALEYYQQRLRRG